MAFVNFVPLWNSSFIFFFYFSSVLYLLNRTIDAKLNEFAWSIFFFVLKNVSKRLKEQLFRYPFFLQKKKEYYFFIINNELFYFCSLNLLFSTCNRKIFMKSLNIVFFLFHISISPNSRQFIKLKRLYVLRVCIPVSKPRIKILYPLFFFLFFFQYDPVRQRSLKLTNEQSTRHRAFQPNNHEISWQSDCSISQTARAIK